MGMHHKAISSSIALVLALAYLMPACTALGTGIMAIEEKNITLNLSSEYNISKNVSVAMAAQTININSTTPSGKNASLMLMSFSMEGNDSMPMNPEEFSNFMETMYIGAIKLMGAKQIGQQTVVSPLGKNVTLYTFSTPGSNKNPEKNSTMAFWDLDKYMHVIMTSDLDQNESARLIESLKMMP
jgi:hypothetical protein